MKFFVSIYLFNIYVAIYEEAEGKLFNVLYKIYSGNSCYILSKKI